MGNTAVEEIIKILEEFNAHFTELSTFLVEKQNRVLADDLIWLNDALPTEQKLVMKSSSLENRRLKLMESLGLKDRTSSVLLEECPDDYKGKLRLELVNLEKHIDRVKQLNDDTLESINRKMAAAEDFLRSKGAAGAEVYGAKGSRIRLNNPEDDIIGSI